LRWSSHDEYRRPTEAEAVRTYAERLPMRQSYPLHGKVRSFRCIHLVDLPPQLFPRSSTSSRRFHRCRPQRVGWYPAMFGVYPNQAQAADGNPRSALMQPGRNSLSISGLRLSTLLRTTIAADRLSESILRNRETNNTLGAHPSFHASRWAERKLSRRAAACRPAARLLSRSGD